MKAFIMTILAPDEWEKRDVLTIFNVGVRAHAPAIQPLEYNATVIEELELKDPK